MKQIIAVLIVILAILLTSCVVTTLTKNKFGHFHDYPYKPPHGVKESDETECSVIANEMAFKAMNEYATASGGGPSVYAAFGLLGAIVELSVEGVRINRILNTTYEQTMKSCLHEKGYSFADFKN